MLLTEGVANSLADLPGQRLANRFSLYEAIHGQFGEINRLISPSTAGGVSAIGAQVQQIAGPRKVNTEEPSARQQQPQLVPVTLQAWDPANGRALGAPVLLGYEWTLV